MPQTIHRGIKALIDEANAADRDPQRGGCDQESRMIP